MELGSYGNEQGKDNKSSKQEVPNEVVNDAPDVKMEAEASITAEDVMRAGGFGATDSVNSILPIASDSTDFEDHLRKSRDYEHLENDEVKNTGNSEALSMEANITSDDVIRAGGFGAKDDISNFLPVASDFTDFEASLRNARDYEDRDEEIKHPGLGWTDKTK